MLQFKNSELAPVINFISEIPLKGRASRGRTKLIMVLSEKHQELLDDIELLKSEHGVDADVSEEVQDSEEYQRKVSEYNTDFSELVSESISADFSEYQHFIESLVSGLYNCDIALSGQESLIYDKILEQLEEEIAEGADE